MSDERTRIRGEIEEFLFREAFLLDTLRFDEWFDLLTDDIRYTMPSSETTQGHTERSGELDGALHFGVLDETKDTLRMRVRQLATGLRHVEIPPSVTERLITNVLAERVSTTPDEVDATSKFLIVQIRHGTHESQFTGRRVDRLRRVDGAWLLARRRVTLTQAVLPRSVSIFF